MATRNQPTYGEQEFSVMSKCERGCHKTARKYKHQVRVPVTLPAVVVVTWLVSEAVESVPSIEPPFSRHRPFPLEPA